MHCCDARPIIAAAIGGSADEHIRHAGPVCDLCCTIMDLTSACTIRASGTHAAYQLHHYLPKLCTEGLAVVPCVKLQRSVPGAQIVQQLLGIDAEWALGPAEDNHLQGWRDVKWAARRFHQGLPERLITWSCMHQRQAMK